jgi:hypothetical protein
MSEHSEQLVNITKCSGKPYASPTKETSSCEILSDSIWKTSCAIASPTRRSSSPTRRHS